LAEKIIESTSILTDGICFGEGPRWHDGKFWLSDMHDHKVLSVDAEGNKTVEAEVPAKPSGLGWLPDGRMLIVSMTNRQLLVKDGDNLSTFADLSALASFHCNDMVTDSQGRTWVGNFGFDLWNQASRNMAELVYVSPEGEARVVAEDMAFPNGAVVTPDGSTLIVGETMGARLTAFDIQDDGSLTNRRTWATLEGVIPDGICLDAELGVWLACPMSGQVVRVLEGGEVTHRVKLGRPAFACMLGGEDGCTLYMLTSSSSEPDDCAANRDGRVETIQANAPRAGCP